MIFTPSWSMSPYKRVLLMMSYLFTKTFFNTMHFIHVKLISKNSMITNTKNSMNQWLHACCCRIFQTLRDCMKTISNHDQCLSNSHRFKRTSVPVIEKSFMEKVQKRKQMCQTPCQRHPLLVDKTKILAYLGFGQLVNQLNGFGLFCALL